MPCPYAQHVVIIWWKFLFWGNPVVNRSYRILIDPALISSTTMLILWAALA